MDIFISFLTAVSVLLLLNGLRILCDRSLEIGRMIGIFWIAGSVGFGGLAAILWAIMHLSIKVV